MKYKNIKMGVILLTIVIAVMSYEKYELVLFSIR